MALPTIVFNSTGSNTAASGAPSSFTAIFGTAAALASNTTVTLAIDAPDLTGVATDGSAAIWVDASSGRQWSKITAVDNGAKTVTVETAYSVTEATRNWGIGGKRATLAGSTQLGLDLIGGWTIDIQTAQTLTANFRVSPTAVASVWTTVTSTTGTRPLVTTATNSIYGLDIQGANRLVISHLSFSSTAATRGNGIAPASTNAASYVIVTDCILDGFAVGIQDHDDGSNVDVFGLQISSTEIKNGVTGLNLWAGCDITGCYVHDCTSQGLLSAATRTRTFNIANSIFDNNGGTGGSSCGADIRPAAQTAVMIRNCNFTNSLDLAGAGDGLMLNYTNAFTAVIENCIFYGNNRYGIQTSGTPIGGYVAHNCAFGGNGTAAVLAPATTGTNPITLSGDPFEGATDFALNSTAGAGASCRAAGIEIPNASATADAPDVGAIQSGQAAAGGAGPLIGGRLVHG